MQLFGLIGNRLDYSFSKQYFTKKFESEQLTNCLFCNFELLNITEIEQLLATNKNLRGFAVTIPFKKEIIKYVNIIDEVVAEIDACNCVAIKNNLLVGYNTDVIGFAKSLQPVLQPHFTHALILGNGGAAAAIKYVLQSLHIQYTVVTTNKTSQSIAYNEVTKTIIDTHFLIINTTPLGTFPNINSLPNLPYEFLSSQHFLYDLVYNPSVTAFLAKGIEKGCTTKNGQEMLELQAEENWKIWMGG
jgi:shikimate dehydrogenase